MSSEAYETGLYSGENHYITNIATQNLNSDNTGLWVTGKLKTGASKDRFAFFYIEVFDSNEDALRYNRGIYEQADLLSCQFSGKLLLTFINCFMLTLTASGTVISGRIVLNHENEKGEKTVIRTFKHAKVLNGSFITWETRPVNETIEVKLTMNSSDLVVFENTFEFSSKNVDDSAIRKVRTASVFSKFFGNVG